MTHTNNYESPLASYMGNILHRWETLTLTADEFETVKENGERMVTVVRLITRNKDSLVFPGIPEVITMF